MLKIEKAKIYGVDGVGSSSPTLTRTDSAEGLTYSVGDNEITSDFDYCYPWRDMEEVQDSNGNVFIKIPKFYAKVTNNSDGTMKFQISGVRYDGFSTLFIDGKGNEIDYVLVGKYEGSGDATQVYSKSGQTVLVSKTMDAYRTACEANGKGYQQFDFLINLIINFLFTIEFATTNSQGLMYGFANTSNTAAISTGTTDATKTASGSAPKSDTDEDETTANLSGYYGMKYRGIENLYGNTWTNVDGVFFYDEKIYICTDPTEYISDPSSTDDDGNVSVAFPYVYCGDRPTAGGWIKTISNFDKNPLLMFASTTGSSATTYYCDYSWYDSGARKLLYGGRWDNGTGAGLWLWYGNAAPSVTYSFQACRLCYKPL